MSWDFRILSPAEAAAVSASLEEAMNAGPGFEEHEPRTPLAALGDIVDWFARAAPDAERVRPDTWAVPIGADGGCSLHLITARWSRIAGDALRQGKSLLDALGSYVPEADEPVVEISVACRGCGNTARIARLAAWLGAVVMDCSSGEFMTPEEWMGRGA